MTRLALACVWCLAAQLQAFQSDRLPRIEPVRNTMPVCAGCQTVKPQPIFTPDHLLMLEEIGSVVSSPSGQLIAYEHVRKRTSAHDYQRPLGGYDRADVWIMPASGGNAVNITRGEADGSGFWNPKWSPDGRRLAMLSTRGGGNVRIWVWDSHAKLLEPISSRGIANFYDAPNAFLWIDNNRLAAVLMPEGHATPDFSYDHASAEVAMREWQKAWAGQQSTVSAIDTGVPVDLMARPQQQLVLLAVDSRNRHEDVIASAASIRYLRPAKDGRYLSYARQVSLIQPNALEPLVDSGDFAEYRYVDTDIKIHKSSVPNFTGRGREQLKKSLKHGLNTFLRDIQPGETRKIRYHGRDGQALDGWILLPTRYQSGRRVPAVVWVYPGDVQSDTPPDFTRLDNAIPFNLQLLAARGYAVLFPSMPLPADPKNSGQPGDPYLELTSGVVPMIDVAIGDGLIDPERLAVMGHSYGGFGTYGLITLTHRFRAAIAIAGTTDLISQYGTFDARDRYGPIPQENYWATWLTERQHFRMANPPWKDLNRYLRNSPLAYVERVQTPIMIVHGDVDPVHIQQAEEFFTALHRQGKRARFLRYWGEGHVLSSPANIRDFWYQTYAWLDEFCDVARDANGHIRWDGDRVRSRNGAPDMKSEDYTRLELSTAAAAKL